MSAKTAAATVFAAIGLAVSFASGQAFADLITAHLTGTFSSGTVDTFGYFGTAGADFSGLAFSLLTTYASSGSNIIDSDTATAESISTTGASGAPFEESLTVGSSTITLSVVTSGLASFSSSQNLVNLKVGGTGNVSLLRSFTTQFSSNVGYGQGLLDTQAGFNAVLSGIETPPGGGFFGFKLQGSGGANSETLTINAITGTSSTPEPSSLALLGVGLTGLAYFHWRRRANLRA